MSSTVNLCEESEEFDDWHLNVTLNGERCKFLCCPEDVQCSNLENKEHSKKDCCEKCVAPVCRECFDNVADAKPKLPPSSLANDMMIFYPPKMLYEEKVTMMEMICSSVCITSIMCFTLEKKFRNVRAMDETVHSNEHRMAFRGNATSFPLPWEDLMVQLRDSQTNADASSAVSLPRSGAELANVVSILLKSAGGDNEKKANAKLIHQATVRRHIVIKLIAEMQRRGHGAYVNVDMAKVVEKARSLPEGDVPPEIIRLLPLDQAHDALQPNKNATPVQGEVAMSEVSKEMACTRINGVVGEASSFNLGDDAARVRSCLSETTRRLGKEFKPSGSDSDGEADGGVDDGAGSHRVVDRIGVKTGSHLIDQYEPVYWGTAFAFTFSYYCGFPDMPAFLHKPRHRRPADAPRIETGDWVKTMSRRIEASVCQDYTFGYVSWNWHFRSELNLSRSLYAYERKNGVNTGASFTPQSLEAGAIEITELLWGSYKDCNGKMQKVNGDIAKVEYVPHISDAARMLLKNIGYTSRKLPGTIETRRMMRFITQAYRIKYGTAIFITFSPDEKHNLLMVRLSRTRQNDPVWGNSDLRSHKRFAKKRRAYA